MAGTVITCHFGGVYLLQMDRETYGDDMELLVLHLLFPNNSQIAEYFNNRCDVCCVYTCVRQAGRQQAGKHMTQESCSGFALESLKCLDRLFEYKTSFQRCKQKSYYGMCVWQYVWSKRGDLCWTSAIKRLSSPPFMGYQLILDGTSRCTCKHTERIAIAAQYHPCCQTATTNLP